jgi:hypothetical protein
LRIPARFWQRRRTGFWISDIAASTGFFQDLRWLAARSADRRTRASFASRHDFQQRIHPSIATRRSISMNLKQLKTASQICFLLGFASIVASIAIWYLSGGTEPESQAHAERFGIFVGLWAPTFFILSNRFDRFSEKS